MFFVPQLLGDFGFGPHFLTPLVLLQSWQIECHVRIPFLTFT